MAAVSLGFTLNKYSQLKQNYNKLSQKQSQTLEENRQLSQECKQLTENHNKTLKDLTQSIQENTQLKEENKQLNNKFNQLTEKYQQSEQNYTNLNKKHNQLTKKYEKLSKDFNTLAQAYHIIARENEELKGKLKQKEETKTQTLEEAIQKEVLRYNSRYGFPRYEVGLLDGQNNWESSDSLDNKGWQVINKKNPKNAWKPFSHNVLTFIPFSNFKTFSSNDNYATFHLYSNKLIKNFSIGGEYNISENGFLKIFISGDNKNWVELEHFESKRKDNFYRVAFGSTPYYADTFPYIKLKNDLYVRHSAGATSNQNYKVEIWSFSAYLTVYKDYKEKAKSIHSLSKQISFLEEMKKGAN